MKPAMLRPRPRGVGLACALAPLLATIPAARTAHADEPSADESKSESPELDPARYRVPDEAHLRYTLYPGMKTRSSTGADTANLSGSLHQVDARFLVPLVFHDGETVLIAGLDYTFTHYSLSGLQDADLATGQGTDNVTLSPVPSDLHAIVADLGMRQRIAPQWSAFVGLKPGLYSDLRVLDAQSLSLQGAAVVSYRPTERLSIGVGFSYQSRFGSPLLLPALQLDWYMGAGMHLHLVAPDDAELVWVSDRVVLSLFGRIEGGSYRIHPPATLQHTDPATGQTTTQPVSFAYDLSYSTIAAGPGLRVRLGGGLYAVAEAPVALSRRWDANNLCADSSGRTSCVDGPSSVNLSNVGSLSFGVTAGLELRY